MGLPEGNTTFSGAFLAWWCARFSVDILFLLPEFPVDGRRVDSQQQRTYAFDQARILALSSFTRFLVILVKPSANFSYGFHI